MRCHIAPRRTQQLDLDIINSFTDPLHHIMTTLPATRSSVQLQPSFLLHIFVELPASIKFFTKPSFGLANTLPSEAEAIIRQYALLLFVSVMLACIFLRRSKDETSRRVAFALAVYHVAPLARAMWRIYERESQKSDLGGPYLHLAAHLFCCTALFTTSFRT